MTRPTLALTLAATMLAGTASAATISIVDGPGHGTPFTALPDQFQNLSGNCGTGGSVVTDGCSVLMKSRRSSRQTGADRDGRFNVLAEAAGERDQDAQWLDSQDIDELLWTVSEDFSFTSMTFAIVDAFDQKRHREYGRSSFTLKVAGEEWEIPTRQKNGNVHWIDVVFDSPTQVAELGFSTRLDDGYAVIAGTTAPVPLPAAAWLLLGGMGILGWTARRNAECRKGVEA